MKKGSTSADAEANENALETHRVDTDEIAVETHRVDTDAKAVETPCS